jgi:hypothetical protein
MKIGMLQHISTSWSLIVLALAFRDPMIARMIVPVILLATLALKINFSIIIVLYCHAYPQFDNPLFFDTQVLKNSIKMYFILAAN